MTEFTDGTRYIPSTTHAEWGSGHPRLLISREDERFHYEITGDVVRIGSSDDCDVRLTDADPIHATVDHEEDDEYVLTMHGKGEMSGRSFDPEHRVQTLRTGARFTIGPWTLVYARDEYADHGRPYGGRQGGEGAKDRVQPPRPDYSHHADAPPKEG